MSKTSKTIRKVCALAGISVLAATASALPIDARIMIDRALNSPTLTVRYTGANAALVELRVNGESLGTRSVTASKSSGETNFTLNLTELKDGDNDVEIRLFDRTGKLISVEKSNISTDQTQYGPVFLRTPKVGQTVRDNVEINLGFGRELKNVYVSFFVDNNFKKITNYPPYTFNWDTRLETNGWHEVEAWAIDESSTTFKTRKTRVFVNNPGGRTDRPGVSSEATPMRNQIRTQVGGAEAGLKNQNVKAGAKATGAQSNGLAPKQTGIVMANQVHGTISDDTIGLKPAPIGTSMSTGVRNMTPTSTRVSTNVTTVAAKAKANANVAKPAVEKSGLQIVAHNQTVKPSTAVLEHVATATNLVRITRGQRLPNLASFSVVLNNQFVDFDVNPRVDDGVPMTPFRHLLEKAGGKVNWENLTKTVKANADGKNIVLHIGDKLANVNNLSISLEVAPYIDRGRTIVPLSFLHDALNVDVEYDKETGHVLITSAQK